MSIDSLVLRQNPDGGWPFATGPSWTEPTVFAIMAALTLDRPEAAARGINWLRTVARPDGGWAPQRSVEESTWVTAMVTMLPPDRIGNTAYTRGINWLLRVTGRESSAVYRLRQLMMGNVITSEKAQHGWPFFPGSAAWVSPTVFGVLALERAHRRRPAEAVAERVEMGRRFLLDRICTDGGWNYGSVSPLGYACRAYPETTGMALLALRGSKCPELERGLTAASNFLSECRTADGQNWLRLGLAAHGRLPANYCPPDLAHRTVRDLSIGLLADAAATGRNLFL